MELRGVRVHNLQGIDVTIPWGQWITISGVSGSGKSSLAFDTLYAEGQRRYLESLSPGSRRFLEQLPLPDADRIDPLPAAIAVRQTARAFPPRTTLGTATELSEYLRLLFAKAGRIVCPECQQTVERQSPLDVLKEIHALETGVRYFIAFPKSPSEGDGEFQSWLSEELAERGFTRAIWNHQTVNLQKDSLTANGDDDLLVVVDRLTAGKSSDERVMDSLEQAFSAGEGRCVLLSEHRGSTADAFPLDGKTFWIQRFSEELACGSCGRMFPEPEPRLFNPNSPLGACETCRGEGTVRKFSIDELVPDPRLTLAEGAIACFKESALADREADWLGHAKAAGIELDVPFEQLEIAQKNQLVQGNSATGFIGLRSLFEELETSTKRTAVDFLDSWLLAEVCSKCLGQKLRAESLAVRIGSENIGDVSRMSITEFQTWVAELRESLTQEMYQLLAAVLSELESRSESLTELGLEYLTVDAKISTLSTGEVQRIAIARTIGHQLASSLYIFDEPSTGLHPADCGRVAKILAGLKAADNTVVVVEHEDEFLQAADHLIDLGPGGGSEGGRVIFQGPPGEIAAASESVTARYVTGAETVSRPHRPEQTADRQIRLKLNGIEQFPLKSVSIEFPLGCLCVLTGVSGSGKSVLLEQVLFPAVEDSLGKPIPKSVRERFGSLAGSEGIENVVLVDQTPPRGRSRSSPITYLSAFDEIRKIFAETPEAQRQGFGLKDFSFNSAGGGRCPHCRGQGVVDVEMQFLADLEMVCPECRGNRYREEILTARYRGLNIAEVLDLTVAEALPFFRTSPRIRKRLQVLKDVGLDYLPLDQQAGTLSGGESQRLKLASFLSESQRGRTLFLLDEPTSGLHPADVQTLLNCFDHLIAVGHSIVVAEHNLHLINRADWVIDLGPGPGQSGGRVLASGPPEEVAADGNSITGRFLREWRTRLRGARG